MGAKRKKDTKTKAFRYARIISNKIKKIKKHLEKHPNDGQSKKRLPNYEAKK